MLANMRPGEVCEITDILAFRDVAVYNCTPQRIAALMMQLAEGGKVSRSVNGRKIMYSLIV